MKYKPGQIVLCPKTVLGGPLSLIMAVKVSGIAYHGSHVVSVYDLQDQC